MSVRRVAVFVSPTARRGRGERQVQEVLRALTHAAVEAGFDTPELVEAASTTEVRERAAALAHARVDRVVAVGGDGLVHQVIQGIAGSRTALAVVPLGTGNDFAGALGIPQARDQAIALAFGPTRSIDLLRSARGWAATVATLGFSAAVNERAERLRRPRGSARYSVATVLELPRLRPIELVMHLGGTAGGERRLGAAEAEQRLRAALVAVANTPMFGGGMRICPAARPDDGLLDVTVIDAVSRADLLRHFLRVFRGTHVRHPAVSTYRARSVTLVAPGLPDATARADGEAWGRLPLTIDAVPRALLVAAPPAAAPVDAGPEGLTRRRSILAALRRRSSSARRPAPEPAAG
ncbi:MAG: diacylglycerol kinase family protein [Acidimicrobiia bacterium]